MNPNTPPPSDDDLPDERELAGLYARLPRAEPPAALDAAILAAATHAPPRRRSRWPIAVGSAAVLVLAVGVGWHLGREPMTSPAPTLPAPPARGAVTRDAPRIAAPSVSSVPAREEAVASPPPTAPRPSIRVQRVERAPAPAPAAPLAADALPSFAPKASLRMRQAMPATSPATVPPSSLPPDDRVAYIRHLLDEGRRDEARREVEALRRSHPRYELPQDLLDLRR